MKMKLYILLLQFVITANALAQSATITFATDKDCEIIVYEPIDGTFNTKIPKSRLTATRSQSTTYTIEISSCIFVYCQFPQYQKTCNIIIFPNDSIELSINEKQIKFQGSNCEGQQYFYDNFQKEPFLEEYLKIQHVFEEYLDKKREVHSILPAIDDSLQISFHLKKIEELRHTPHTTTEFSDVLKTEAYMFFYGNIIDLTDYLLQSIPKYEHISKDSIEIENMADAIFQKYPLKPELTKYSSILYVFNYLSHYYNGKECPAGYDSATFGPYKTYLYAPKEMQPGLLGGACMTQLKYNSGEMDLNKLKKFFNEKFPESQYTAIINQKVLEETDSIDQPLASQKFIKESIDSLIQLKDIPELKNRYVFIDLWASWCMPCRAEFSFKKELHQILDMYKNIVMVYVSIDNEKQEKAWHNCIKHYKLEGYHLRATAELQKDIRQQVYGTDSYDIPRYILIGPNGSILNKDLPRPSDYPKLKEELDKAIYSKPIPK